MFAFVVTSICLYPLCSYTPIRQMEDRLRCFVASYNVVEVFIFDDHLLSFETSSCAGGIPVTPEGQELDRVKWPQCFDAKAVKL